MAVTFLTAEERKFYHRHKKMPKVVGWSDEKVDRFFEPIGEVFETDLRESSKVPIDKRRVIKQSPKAGKRLRVGQQITLVIGYNVADYSSTDYDYGDGDLPDRNRGESRFCSGRWWCRGQLHDHVTTHARTSVMTSEDDHEVGVSAPRGPPVPTTHCQERVAPQRVIPNSSASSEGADTDPSGGKQSPLTSADGR
ncbi:PASTA domain-containing protein [Nonomuraea ferruginea]|uniref:PASTA domain-containing protein n=1 Tax=Nonomuraea ferruginea TaxID=46174 RepID=UPI0031EC939C